MKLATLDRHPDYSQGLGPLGTCLQWLDTLLKSPAVTWEPAQHEHAAKALRDARELMLCEATMPAVGGLPLRLNPSLPADGFEIRPPQLTDGHDAPPVVQRLDQLMHACRHDRRTPTYADLLALRETCAHHPV